MRRERGITLIALVITVIVMLILVGVTVTSAINGGLFSKAKNASTETENAKIFEQIQLAVVASKKFENEIQYEELLDLLSAKKNSGNFEEQSYNMYKEFIELIKDKTFCAKTIADAVQSNNQFAISIFKESAIYLGKGLSILIDILNLDKIIIGGIYARMESFFKNIVLSVIKEEALKYSADFCSIEASFFKEK